MKLVLLSSLAAAMLLPPCLANAYELNWANGSRLQTVTLDSPCTLFVKVAPTEHLTAGWRLLWSTDGSDQDAIQVLPSQLPNVAEQIVELAVPAVPELRANEAVMRSIEAPNNDGIRLGFLLAVKGGIRASIRLVPGPGSTVNYPIGTSGTPEVPFALINGGLTQPTPPVALSASAVNAPDGLRVVVTGIGLTETKAVSLQDSLGVVLRFGQINSATGTLLNCSFGTEVDLSLLWLVLSDNAGFASTVRLPGAALAPASPTELIVRFRPEEAERIAPLPNTPQDFSFRSSTTADALASAGVTRLTPLFPDTPPGKSYDVNLAGEPIRIEDLSTVYVASLAPGTQVAEAARTLRGDPSVAYVNANGFGFSAAAVPNDSLYPDQWGLHNTGQTICGYNGASAGIDIGAESAWNTTFGAATETVAVLDTGLDITHKEFENHYSLGPDFYGHQPSATDTVATGIRHGTGVAGVISALTNNLTGLAGVAGSCVPLPVRLGSDAGFSTSKALLKAIDWATARGTPIINVSQAYNMSFFNPFYFDTTDTSVVAVGDACRNAFYKGQLLLAAMGNDNDNTVNYPAALTKTVTAIGAVGPNGARWQDETYYPGNGLQRGSCFGNWIDFVAPGGVWMTAPSFGPYGYFDLTDCGYLSGSWFSGTSSATPMASGVAALLQSARPTLLGEDIVAIWRRIARDVGLAGFDDSTGYGLLNASDALAYLGVNNKALVHGTIGAYGNAGTLVIADSQTVSRTFANVPGLADGAYTNAVRYRLVGNAGYSTGFTVAPDVWGRSSGTLGWPDITAFDYSYEVNVADVIPGSVTATSCSLQTYVFRVPGQGWFPCTPESARAAFSALGSSSLVGVDGGPSAARWALRVAPNPAGSQCRVQFNVPTSGRVRVDLINVTGRLVRTLDDRNRPRGQVILTWDGHDNYGYRCAAGVYFCRVSGPQTEARIKITYVP